jgi:hypothetical protein
MPSPTALALFISPIALIVAVQGRGDPKWQLIAELGATLLVGAVVGFVRAGWIQ